ncbi:MAG: GAF domain-containing sensor histidine kinase [Dehalococcoidia bacterium]
MISHSPTLLRAVHEAALAISDELRLDVILGRMIDVARPLVDARYGALGVPDGEGGFARFITSGMTEDQIEAIGPLPRQHGLLALMLEDPAPVRYPDIRQHPRFEYWPRTHPTMKSFLGVPIVYRSEIVGAFYLTDKEGEEQFTDEDEQAIVMLAAHAAIAIQNARLFELSRELTATEERNRLARELHDSVAQTLFNIVLESEVAASLVDSDPMAARERLSQLSERAREASTEIRSLIFELRPADLARDGLATTLRKHAEAIARVHSLDLRFDVRIEHALPASQAQEVFRIAQEALNNITRHAGATQVEVFLSEKEGRLLLHIADDGVGFDTRSQLSRSYSLGLTSMEERAKGLGGRLTLESVPGRGTTVTLSMPLPHPSRGEIEP